MRRVWGCAQVWRIGAGLTAVSLVKDLCIGGVNAEGYCGLLGVTGGLGVSGGWRIGAALTAIGDCARIVQSAYRRWLIADRQDRNPLKCFQKLVSWISLERSGRHCNLQVYCLADQQSAIADTHSGLSLRNHQWPSEPHRFAIRPKLQTSRHAQQSAISFCVLSCRYAFWTILAPSARTSKPPVNPQQSAISFCIHIVQPVTFLPNRVPLR